MKEIGSEFKSKREEIGLRLEEVSGDLEVTIPQLENLEDGNINAFKDVFFLKELIKKYAIYLNLDDDDIMDKFSDFVFDFTSKIPISEIEAKVKEIAREEEAVTRKSINSPYTAKKVMRAKLKPIYLYILVTVFIIAFALIIVNTIMNV